MTTGNVINIDDARELRELGLPILPVVDAEFSNAASSLFFRADKARAKFYRALAYYCKTTTPTRQKYNRLKDALYKVAMIRNRAARFTSSQYGEAWSLQALLTEPMTSFIDFWEEALACLEEGEAIEIVITREMLDGWSVR